VHIVVDETHTILRLTQSCPIRHPSLLHVRVIEASIQ